jgi:hypothetical protein
MTHLKALRRCRRKPAENVDSALSWPTGAASLATVSADAARLLGRIQQILESESCASVD